MQMEQRQALEQKLALTPMIRQALNCLQLSAMDLNEYLQELALSNPLLDVQPANYTEVLPTETPHEDPEEADSWVEWRASAQGKNSGAAVSFASFLAQRQSFADYLEEQLGQSRLLDERMRALCRYLIGCLDRRGYLDCPIQELAEEIGCAQIELEQALYVVQMLDPPGVGARSLSECLILQLVQLPVLDSTAMAIARDGLELLSKRDYSALAQNTGVSVKKVREAAEKILQLNPVPARGFPGSEQTLFIVPDVICRREKGKLVVEFDDRVLPRVSIQSEYLQLAQTSDDETTREYVKEKLGEATQLLKNLKLRGDTLLRVTAYLTETQREFFHGGELRPITMQQAGEELGLSTSTVSRAIQNKYLQFDGKMLPLRSFFTTAVRTTGGGSVSAQAVRQRISYLIREEDASAPLSDEALRLALEKSGVLISRRAVAKHRAALGFPPASKRKR